MLQRFFWRAAPTVRAAFDGPHPEFAELERRGDRFFL